jgi:IS30 family transposase
MTRFWREVHRRFWAEVRAGSRLEEAAAAAGVSRSWAWEVFREAGGVNPMRVAPPAGRYLSWSEREEIAALTHAGVGVREIARRLGRAPSTVSRELARGDTPRGYRVSVGQGKAERARTGRRGAKLAGNLRLRREVAARLQRRDSPEQISGRLRVDFPDELEMRVSPETIYQSLYVQARGGLKRELTVFLRTGRSMRKPRRREGERRGRIPGMVMISERPPEVADRAVPGHWEGDLLEGSRATGTAVGTLVERSTGFVMLVHLPDGHGPLAVQEALVATITTLPDQLRRSLTWDQGKELMNHAAIAEAADIDIYFCDPKSPWQRGSNENTNGLLRQYLPKGSDLGFYGPGLLDNIAAELNNRPRKRYGFRTPAEMLDQLLSQSATDHGVA